MTKKKERRTPPPTMESIVHKAQVRMGEAEYKRSTDQTEDKKVVEEKKSEKEIADKLLWGKTQTLALMKAIIEHNDSRKDFLKATVDKIRSEKKETDTKIWKSQPFKEKHIMSKAQALVSQMKKDGYEISIPKKDAQTARTDYNAMYAELGALMPPKAKKKK